MGLLGRLLGWTPVIRYEVLLKDEQVQVTTNEIAREVPDPEYLRLWTLHATRNLANLGNDFYVSLVLVILDIVSKELNRGVVNISQIVPKDARFMLVDKINGSPSHWFKGEYLAKGSLQRTINLQMSWTTMSLYEVTVSVLALLQVVIDKAKDDPMLQKVVLRTIQNLCTKIPESRNLVIDQVRIATEAYLESLLT